MIKYVIFFATVALVLAAISVLCFVGHKKEKEKEKATAAATGTELSWYKWRPSYCYVLCFVLVIVLAVACVAPSLMKSGVEDSYNVAFKNNDTITLVSNVDGDSVKIDLDEVYYDDSIVKGDTVVLIRNFWGPQYIDKPAGNIVMNESSDRTSELTPGDK